MFIGGEHGQYDQIYAFGGKKYPRYEFFKQVTSVFKEEGRAVPVFSDKHLSWKWDWASEMVAESKRLGFPFMAGSSLPTAWRMPPVDVPHGARVEEAMVVSIGSPDSYDFHALDCLQSFVERRRGGETGVVSVECCRGEKLWAQMAAGSWAAGGYDPALLEACLSRSHKLTMPARHRGAYGQRQLTAADVRALVDAESSFSYRVEHTDGLHTTLLVLNGLVGDLTVAAKLRPDGPNDVLRGGARHAEHPLLHRRYFQQPGRELERRRRP